MTNGLPAPDIGIGQQNAHNWYNEYGFVDISAVSIESELKYGYDFMNSQIAARKQFILDLLNGLKSQAINLQNLSQSVKNSLEATLASYDDNREDNYLGCTKVYCVSLNEEGPGGAARVKNKALAKDHEWIVKQQVGPDVFYYYDKSSGNFSFTVNTPNPVYNSDEGILQRCRAIKAYMNTPTSYFHGTTTVNYDMRDEGVYAAIEQIEKDWVALESSVEGLVNQIKKLGYDFTPSSDVDATITNLIEFINSNIDESAIEKDSKITAYRLFLQAVVKLSAQYLPVKYEYDSIYKDQKQRSYLSEFQPDPDMSLAALDRLSSYSVEKDAANKAAIL